MKYLTFLLALTFIFSSCQSKKEKEEKLQKELQVAAQEMMKDRIDLEMDATPKYFSAKTIDGKTFNSEDYKGKNLVIFVYNENYLKKSDTYDMPSEHDIPTELNEIYDKYKDQAHFVGILDDAVEDKDQALADMKNAGIKSLFKN